MICSMRTEIVIHEVLKATAAHVKLVKRWLFVGLWDRPCQCILESRIRLWGHREALSHAQIMVLPTMSTECGLVHMLLGKQDSPVSIRGVCLEVHSESRLHQAIEYQLNATHGI